MARATSAKLTLLHVDEIASMGIHDAPEWERYVDQLLHVRNQRLDQELEKLEQWGVDAEVEIAVGTPMVQILEYVEDTKPDLLVLAKHGRRGLERVLMGSVSRRIVRESSVPALVVHAYSDPEPGEYEEPAEYRHILTATDFSEDANLGVVFSMHMQAVFGVKVSLAHVIQPPLIIPGFPGDAPIQLPRVARAQMETHQTDQLRQILEQNNLDWETLVAVGHVPDTIVALAVGASADLIVIPGHGHGAVHRTVFGSTAESVLELSELPVLVLPKSYLHTIAEPGQASN
jgi:nucleotide-binding universal stress UspA family protein